MDRGNIDNKGQKIAVLALCYYFVFGLSNVSYFLPVYYAQSGALTPREAGLIVSIFYIVSVFSRPFLAYVLSSLGFRRLFAWAGVLFVASAAAMAAFGLSFWPALAARGVMGLASSLYKIGFSTYQALAFREGERGRAYSLIMAGELLPLMTIAPVADALIKAGRLDLYILVPVAMSALSAVAAALIPGISSSFAGAHTMRPPDVADSQRVEAGARFAPLRRADDSDCRPNNPFAGMGQCLGLRTFRLALLSTFLFSMTDAAASFMSSMTAHYGLMASLFLSSNALVGVCVRLFLSRALDRFPRRILAAGTILLTAGSLFLASVNPNEASLVLLGLVFGVGMGFGFPLHLALVADSVPHSRQAQASAMMWFTIGINFSAVPLLMGWFESRFGPVLILRGFAMLALLGAMALCLQQEPQKIATTSRQS